MKEKKRKLEKYKKISKICSIVGVGSITLACVAFTGFFLGFGTLIPILLTTSAICLAPCHVTYYILARKIEELEVFFNSSINGCTEEQTKFETSEYISCKEDKKEPIVLSPQEIGIDEFKEKHKKEYEADISL